MNNPVSKKPFLLRTILMLCGVFVPAASISAAEWNIPADFPTVQAALDAYDPGPPEDRLVHSGDTLILAPGTYPGFHPYWQSNITICSSHGRDVTFIDGHNSEDPVIWLTSENNCIEGLTVKNFRDEAILVVAAGNRLQNLCVMSYGHDPFAGCGIYLTQSNIEISDVMVSKCGEGIHFDCVSADQCTLTNSYISDCYDGIVIRGHANIVEKVTVSGCTNGICLTASGPCYTLNNIVRKCIIKNNQAAGILMGDSDSYPIEYGNCVYDNYFAGNPVHIDASQGSQGTRWNIEKTPGRNIVGGDFLGGNYWDDYLGSDLDQDGLGDTEIPYGNGILGGGPDGAGEYYSGDYHPLMQMVTDLSIALEELTVPGPTDVLLNETAEQTAEVRAIIRNLGVVPADNVEIVLYAYGFQADRTVLETLPAGGSTSVTFTWDIINTIRLYMRGLEAESHGATNTVWAEPPVKLKVAADPHEHIPDVNPANNSAEKPVVLHIIPDLEITEVAPIQVVRDVPLILNKAMMTRVHMRLAESCQDIFSVVHGIKARVLFDDGNAPQETPATPEMSLVDKAGMGYVVPRNKVSMFRNLMNDNMRLKRELYNYGWDALNLEYVSDTGPAPKLVGSLTIQAVLRNADADVAGNSTVATATVKQSNKNAYRILYMPLDSLGAKHTKKLERHVLMSHNHAAFVEAVFPVPEVREYYGYSRVNAEGRPLDPPTIHGFWFLEQARVARKATLISWFDWVDTVVWVVPYPVLGQGTAGEAYPQAGIGVFVDETQGFPIHVSAHELGHTWGLAGGRGHTEEYDSDKQIIAFYAAGNGWDVKGAVSRLMNNTSHARYSFSPEDLSLPVNYLTHMGDHRVPCPWITAANYRRLMDGMWPWGGLVNGGSDPRMLFVSGEIQEDGTSKLWPFFSRNGMEMPPEAGSYSFDCEADDGTILSSTSFEPWFEQQDETTFACFGFPIPFPEGTANVLLRHEGTVLAQRNVSANPPNMDIGTILETGADWYEMACTADDEDGDDMEFLTAYSNDGISWIPLESTFSTKKGKSAFTFDTLSLPGGNACTVKVIASDGINTIEEVSAPFAVPKKAPTAIIGDPDANAVYHERDTVFFNGFGYDAEDGLVDTATYFWTSSRDGELAQHCQGFSSSTLSVGQHIITLSMQDSDGNPAEAAVTILVEPGFTDSDADTLPDWWEQENFDGLELAAEDDPDGDLYNNADEYAQGTDPNVSDAASEGEGEGEGEAEAEGEGEGEGEGEAEAEGEEPKPPCGCDKSDGSPRKIGDLYGDILLLTLSAVVLALSRNKFGQ